MSDLDDITGGDHHRSQALHDALTRLADGPNELLREMARADQRGGPGVLVSLAARHQVPETPVVFTNSRRVCLARQAARPGPAPGRRCRPARPDPHGGA